MDEVHKKNGKLGKWMLVGGAGVLAISAIYFVGRKLASTAPASTSTVSSTTVSSVSSQSDSFTLSTPVISTSTPGLVQISINSDGSPISFIDWNWADGSTTTTGSGVNSASHQYTLNGSYQILAIATFEDSTKISQTTTVIISNVGTTNSTGTSSSNSQSNPYQPNSAGVLTWYGPGWYNLTVSGMGTTAGLYYINNQQFITSYNNNLQYIQSSTSGTSFSNSNTVTINGMTFIKFNGDSGSGTLNAPYAVFNGWKGPGYYYFVSYNYETSTSVSTLSQLNQYNVALTGSNLGYYNTSTSTSTSSSSTSSVEVTSSNVGSMSNSQVTSAGLIYSAYAPNLQPSSVASSYIGIDADGMYVYSNS